MALNVPLTVTISTVVAFLITPWLALVALRHAEEGELEGGDFDLQSRPLYRMSRAVLSPILAGRGRSLMVLMASGYSPAAM